MILTCDVLLSDVQLFIKSKIITVAIHSTGRHHSLRICTEFQGKFISLVKEVWIHCIGLVVVITQLGTK